MTLHHTHTQELFQSSSAVLAQQPTDAGKAEKGIALFTKQLRRINHRDLANKPSSAWSYIHDRAVQEQDGSRSPRFQLQSLQLYQENIGLTISRQDDGFCEQIKHAAMR